MTTNTLHTDRIAALLPAAINPRNVPGADHAVAFNIADTSRVNVRRVRATLEAEGYAVCRDRDLVIASLPQPRHR